MKSTSYDSGMRRTATELARGDDCSVRKIVAANDMSSAATHQIPNRSRAQRLRFGEEEQSGLCSDVVRVTIQNLRFPSKKAKSKPSAAGSIWRRGAAA